MKPNKNITTTLCIPAFRQKKSDLERILNSVIETDSTYSEILIVDDASGVVHDDLIIFYGRHLLNIKICINEKNLGMVGNWNHALSLVETDFVQFLGHDDYLLESSAELIRDMVESDLGLVSFNLLEQFSEKKKLKNKYILKQSINFLEGSFCQWALAYGGRLSEFSSTIYRTEALKSVGGFSKNFEHSADLEASIRVSLNWPVRYYPKPYAIRVISDQNLTRVHRVSGLISSDRRRLRTQYSNLVYERKAKILFLLRYMFAESRDRFQKIRQYYLGGEV